MKGRGKMKCKKMAMLLATVIGITPITSFAEGLGICSHVSQGYAPSASMEVVENADIEWVRDECKWDSVETAKGSFSVPEGVKAYFKAAKEQGVKTLLILCYGNDAYTLSNGTKSTIITMPRSSESEYMEGWKQYVRTVAEELGDYIDAYEVWNEPDLAYANSLITSNMSDFSGAAEVYVDMYVQTKEILSAIQPGKPVLFGCKCDGGTSESTTAFYDEMKAVAQANGKTFNDYVDDVSIHFYAADVKDAASILSDWDSTFDKYGFTGNVWLTETGLSETVEEDFTQEEYLHMVALDFDRSMKESGREGVSFWYDLRNDGTDSTDYESNFGLVDYYYNEKPLFYAMKVRNIAVNDMPLTNYVAPQTGTSGIFNTTKEYGAVGTYSDGINTTYVGYDANANGATYTVNLSGTKAYVYDYLGNITATLDPNTIATYNLQLNKQATYVACVNPRAYIDYAGYDKTHNVVKVNGKVSEFTADSIKLTATNQAGNTVYSENVPVKNGEYETEFSPAEAGIYTVTVGVGDVTYYAQSEVKVASAGMMLGDSVVSISDKTVTITGTVEGAENGETVSVLVVPQGTDLTNLKPENIAFVDDVEIIAGTYSFKFEMPEKSDGTYKVLLSGVNVANASEEVVNYGTASGFVNVCDFHYTFGENIIKVKARVNNPAAESKNCEIIIVQYTAEKEMTTMNTTKVTMEPNFAQAIEKEATATKDSEATLAKAFIWDSLTGLQPLVDGLQIPLN